MVVAAILPGTSGKSFSHVFKLTVTSCRSRRPAAAAMNIYPVSQVIEEGTRGERHVGEGVCRNGTEVEEEREEKEEYRLEE